MEHKYSTFVLLFVLGVVGVTMLVSSIEGFGTKNVLSRFDGNDLLVNSSIFDDLPNGSVMLLSTVCTSNNSLCSGVVNNITYYVANLTINTTVYGNMSNVTDNGDGTFTWIFTGGYNFTTSNLTGPPGANGAAGATGPQGPQGPPGNSSSSVGNGTLVKVMNGSIGDGTFIDWSIG